MSLRVICIWTGPSPKKYHMDLRSFGPYNIFLVTYQSIYCHMTLSAMNYLLYNTKNNNHFIFYFTYIQYIYNPLTKPINNIWTGTNNITLKLKYHSLNSVGWTNKIHWPILINTHPHDKQTINQNYLDIRIYPLKYQSPMFFFNLFKNL
jgi:hypothetical protein